MRQRLPYLAIAALTLCIGLGTALAVVILSPVDVSEAQAEPARPEPQTIPPAAPYAAPPQQIFAEMDERFLMSPFRKAYRDPPPPPPAPSAPPAFTLIGIIVEGDTRLAIVKLPGAPIASSLSVGAMLGGWQVVRIEPDRLALHAGSSDQEFKLQTHPAAK